MKKLLLIGLISAATSLAAHASFINGGITFDGTVNMDKPSAGTSTMVTGWHGVGGIGSAFVADADGSFAAFVTPGDGVTFHAPWTFNSGPISAFWTVDGFTFDLTVSVIQSQHVSTGPSDPGDVDVAGFGTISGHGFTPTTGTWSFTTQDPGVGTPARFSFSAAGNAVPDGGSTAVLLGAVLVGLATVRRQFAKA